MTRPKKGEERGTLSDSKDLRRGRYGWRLWSLLLVWLDGQRHLCTPEFPISWAGGKATISFTGDQGRHIIDKKYATFDY